jgi:hypothetical protein
MKYFYFASLVSVLFFSCKEPKLEGEFDEVTLYYYGRSHSGTTYEVPLKFYINGKETAFFVLYSLSPDLESGVYSYNDSLYINCQIFNDFAFTDKTFYKKVCKMGGNEITDGTVTVERASDKYNFIIDVTDNKGVNHKGTFKGKVKKENYHQQSNVNGLFANASIEKCSPGFPYGLPENYDGGITWIELRAGDWVSGMEVNIIFLHSELNDFTGVHYANSSLTLQSMYYKNLEDRNHMRLVSGTFTVTRVDDKPYKFKIDVDVAAANGDIIQGSFDGGEIWFSGYGYQNYADYYYADYYL